jgi:uncharacterized membrane protein (Fun14 family)
MIGMGERSDVVAHATGLGFGILFGVILGLVVKRPIRILGQGVALLVTVTTLASAWLLAFHKL